jgi:hypothetical protein
MPRRANPCLRRVSPGKKEVAGRLGNLFGSIPTKVNCLCFLMGSTIHPVPNAASRDVNELTPPSDKSEITEYFVVLLPDVFRSSSPVVWGM